MKEGSEGDGGGENIPISRDPDSIVYDGHLSGLLPAVESHPRRLLPDRPPAMGIALASLGMEVVNDALSSSTFTEHGDTAHAGTTLANDECAIDPMRMTNRSSGSSRSESILEGIYSTSNNDRLKGESDGQNRDKQFTCNICHKSFGYKHVLRNHERTHTGEKPFECKECNKRFTRDHHLKAHMRLHTGEKPYHCSHCDRQFVQVANLRRHLRVHTGERPYACTMCESKFSDSNHLKAHVLIHKGVKPYNCEKCNGRFRRRHHLVCHKCPNDEANIGRPRRGRRPRTYDQLPPTIPLKIRISIKKERLTTPIPDLPSPPLLQPATMTSVRQVSLIPLHQPPNAHIQRAVAYTHHPLALPHVSNSRFHDSVQTGPIDLTVSSTPTNSASVIVPRIPPHQNRSYNLNANHMDGVLNLPNSQSDSEVEPT